MNDPGQAVVAASAMPALLSREHASLEFNRRVLAQARRADVPLLERLRYVCIVSSNMDEFFEIRFADYIEIVRRDSAARRELEGVAAEAHDGTTVAVVPAMPGPGGFAVADLRGDAEIEHRSRLVALSQMHRR